MPIIIEMDSVEAVAMLKAPMTDRSHHWSLVEEISSLAVLRARELVFVQCSRWQNNTSHVLVAYGRNIPRTQSHEGQTFL